MFKKLIFPLVVAFLFIGNASCVEVPVFVKNMRTSAVKQVLFDTERDSLESMKEKIATELGITQDGIKRLIIRGEELTEESFSRLTSNMASQTIVSVVFENEAGRRA